MGLRMFDGKDIFFEKTHHDNNKNNGANQTQQNDTNANITREQFVQ